MGNLANVWVCTSEGRLLRADLIARVGHGSDAPLWEGRQVRIYTFFGDDPEHLVATCRAEHVAAVLTGLAHALARAAHEAGPPDAVRFLYLTEADDAAPAWELGDAPPSRWIQVQPSTPAPDPAHLPPPLTLPGQEREWSPWDRTTG